MTGATGPGQLRDRSPAVRTARPHPSLDSRAADIRDNCAAYLRERDHWSPGLNRVQRHLGSRARNVLIYGLGLLLTPRLGRSETVNVFQTAKHAHYMKSFDRRSVLLMGGVAERALAKREGYRFVWSVGVIASVNLALYRNWTLPLVVMLALWRRILGRPQALTVFLYEDTLQHGTFMAHALRDLPNRARSVCIAHGYYTELDAPLRYEGALCDHNFVWDERQAALLGATHSGLHVIGSPHDARAQPSPLQTLVFVGVGHPSAEEAVFARSMACYAEIAEIAERRHGLRVLYRPHPAERADLPLMETLRARFGELDELPLEARLNGPRSVFVGFVSSLLHEASVAGHAVVYVAGHPGSRPVFFRDLDLDADDPSAIDGWLARVKASDSPASAGPASSRPSALERFRRAVAEIDRGTGFTEAR